MLISSIGPVWKPYISGICLGNPLQSTAVDLDMSTLTDPQSFTAFLASRGRGYVLSSDKVGKFQSGYRDHGCNCYASGEELNTECIMSHAWPDMLAWLDMLHQNPDYAEQVMIRLEDMDDETRKALESMTVKAEEDINGEDTAKTEQAKSTEQNQDDAKEHEARAGRENANSLLEAEANK